MLLYDPRICYSRNAGQYAPPICYSREAIREAICFFCWIKMLLSVREYASTHNQTQYASLKSQYASLQKPICFSQNVNMRLLGLAYASLQNANMLLPEYQYASPKNRICFYTISKRFSTKTWICFSKKPNMLLCKSRLTLLNPQISNVIFGNTKNTKKYKEITISM